MNALKCGVQVGIGVWDGVSVWLPADTVRPKVKGHRPNGGKHRDVGLICKGKDHPIDCCFSPWDSEGAI